MSKCFSSDIFKEEIEQSTKAKDESFSQTITNLTNFRKNKNLKAAHLPKIGHIPPYLYITKNKRIEKYNPKELIKSSELTIDTRNPKYYQGKKIPNNTFAYAQYKQFKFPNYKIKNYIHDDLKDKKILLSEFEDIPDYALSYALLPKYQISHTLYRELQSKKNEFMDVFNRQKEIEKENNVNLKKRKILIEQFPPQNIFNRKNNINDILKSGMIKIPYINDLNMDFTTSEKQRYISIMEFLYKLKNFIERYPQEENKLIHEFLMEHNVFDIEYYDIEKINNFSNFLNSDFTIDPKKNFKEKLKDILNGLYNNENNNDLTTQYTETKRLKKKKEYNSQKINKIKINKSVVPMKGLLTHDLEFQRKVSIKLNKLSEDYDLVKNPEVIIEKLEKEFKDEENKSDENRNFTFLKKVDLNNEKLYGNRLSETQYSVLTKKNRLTEYICLLKAKKHYEIGKIEKSLNYKI
jgi:hypothetical protein